MFAHVLFKIPVRIRKDRVQVAVNLLVLVQMRSSSCSKFTSPGANEDYAALVQIGESNGVC